MYQHRSSIHVFALCTAALLSLGLAIERPALAQRGSRNQGHARRGHTQRLRIGCTASDTP